jgi:hypothetical protein
MIYVVKYPSTVVFLALLGVLAGLTPLFDKAAPKALYAGFALAAGQLAFWFLGLQKPACVWAALTLLGLAVLFLLRKKYWQTGLMLLASLAAQMTLVITTLGSERTAFAGIVALIVVDLSLLGRLLWPEEGRRPAALRAGVILALAAVCAVCCVPTLRGYTASKKIVDENLASVEESRKTGVCYFNIDIDPDYRFTMPFEGTYFYDNFRAYYKMSPDTKLVFTSKKWTLGALTDGKTPCVFPTLQNESGLWFPVEYVFSSLGGKAEWSWKNHTYTITLGKKTYLATEKGELYLYQKDGSKQQLASDFTILPPFSDTYTLLYCPADKLTAYFGVRWTFDAAQNQYTLEGAVQK